MTPVPGAWSNRLFRLVVATQSFAVKELRNPWRDPRWSEWLDAAWAFELAAIAAGVDAPEPISNPNTGHCLAWVERAGQGPPAPVRVHRWVQGAPAGPGPVEPHVARWAGRTLARLHDLAIPPSDRSLFPTPNTDTADGWPELVEAASHANAPWADHLGELTNVVKVIADLAHAGDIHPDEEVMSHGDVDQKNIILEHTRPVLCDWDLAVPLVPRRELADTALSLGAWTRLDIARDVVSSYRKARDTDVAIEPADLGQPLMTGLDWIAFNVERAIGLRPADPEEADRARRQVPSLIQELPYKVNLALQVRNVLAA